MVSAIREEEGEGRKVALSFSSEEPYERFFGPEILDHAEGAVNLSRLNSIGCVLYNHNRDKVIGKITRGRSTSAIRSLWSWARTIGPMYAGLWASKQAKRKPPVIRG